MSAPVYVESSDALPIVSVIVSFRSGSAHDPGGREGLSRIVARMFRRGAAGYSALAIEETIDALGGELGADASPSATSVQFEVIRRNLDPFVDLVSTLLARPSFDLAELERLKRETEAELIESRDSDRALASRAFRRMLFADHPYGRRVAGTTTSVRAIAREDVLGHYERHLTRANALVAISGDIDEAEARSAADRLLAKLPEGVRVPDPVPPPKRKPGRHLVLVDKPDRTQTQLVIGSLGTDSRDLDHVPLLVANTAFGGTFTSRLMQEIRVKRGWSYGAYSRVGFDRQRDAFTMWTAPAATDAAACLALELELLHDFCENGVREEELEFVKRYLVRSHAFEVDTARKRVHQKLEADLFTMPDGYHAKYLERVTAVDRASANVAVRERILEDDLVIGVVATKTEIGAALEKAIPKLESVTVLPLEFE